MESLDVLILFYYHPISLSFFIDLACCCISFFFFCVCVGVDVCMHTCRCMWRPVVDCGCLCLLLCGLGGSHRPGACWFSSAVSRMPRGPTCLYHPSPGVMSVCHHTWFLKVCSEGWTLGFMLTISPVPICVSHSDPLIALSPFPSFLLSLPQINHL